MYEILVVYSSATTATRLKNMMEKEGYKCKVVQTPQSLTVGGCGYSIHTIYNNLSNLLILTEKIGNTNKGIYRIDYHSNGDKKFTAI